MAITYAELVDLIQDYTENDEAGFVANIPFIVGFAEARIWQHITPPVMQRTATASMTSGNQYLGLPTGLKEIRSVTITVSGSTVPLLQKDQSYLREAFPSVATLAQPRFYALFDDNVIQIAPVPDVGYTTILDYTALPESIVTAGTSWLGENCDNLLLAACIAESQRYDEGEPDVIAMHEAQFTEALETWKQYSKRMPARDEFRNGQLR